MNVNPILFFILMSCFSSEGPVASTRDAAFESVSMSPGRHKIWITSSLDGTSQPSFLVIPDGFTGRISDVPLVVALHTWSNDLEQQQDPSYLELEREVLKRGWLYLFPNFRGSNDHPEACGSIAARQDILDAVDWIIQHYSVNKDRVYLAGLSGGGYMTMLMAGIHPHRWRAASAWVGISDLTSWYAEHSDDKYGANMRSCFDGAPTDDPKILAQYRERSPIFHLVAAKAVALDLAAGRDDGHGGLDAPVPVSQTLEAFNAIAKTTNVTPVSSDEMEQLSHPAGILANPQASDQAEDKALGRKIYLRRTAGSARVTIFDGGHEWIPLAVIAWFDQHLE